jgi:hypothetical protein
MFVIFQFISKGLLLAVYVVIALPITFSGLAKVAIFTTNVDAENQCLINHKCVCGALNRHFCQTRVSTSPFFSVLLLSVHFGLSWCVGLVALLLFFAWLCGVGKTANVPPNALALVF